MKKAYRSSVVALAASVALVAVGVMPAFASAPSEGSVLKNSLVVKTKANPQVQMGGSSFDANLVGAVYQKWSSLSSNNAGSLASYASSSSGTGRANLISGTFGIGFTDVPLNYAGQDTSTLSNYVEIPVALGGEAIIYNMSFNSYDTTKGPKGTRNIKNTIAANHTFAGSNVQGCTSLLASNPLILNGATLGGIFAGTITSWNNATIEKLNPNLVVKVLVPLTAAKKKGKDGAKKSAPQRDKTETISCLTETQTPKISVISRTAGSGTTFIFRDYLSKVDPTDFPYPSSAAFASASTTFSGSSTLAPAVASTAGAIGYVEQGYAIANHLVPARLVNGAGRVTALTLSDVAAAATKGLENIDADSSCPNGFSPAGSDTYVATSIDTHCFSINNVDAPTAYPIAGFSYAAVDKTISNSSDAIAITKFLLYLTQLGTGSSSYGQNLASGEDYVPLPTAIGAVAYKDISEINGGADISATN